MKSARRAISRHAADSRRTACMALAAVLLALTPPAARAQTTDRQDDPLPVKPPPIPGGVIPLPQGPPITARQGPIPAPVRPLPDAGSPITVSPDLRSVHAAVEDQTITLRDAVAIALYTNRDFASAVAALLQAQGRTGQARSQLGFTAGVNGQITAFDAPTTANFGPTPVVIIPQFNPTFTASVMLPLDITGTLHSAVSQAQFQEVAARIDVNRVRNDTVYAVKSAFYNALRAQAQIGVAVEAQNNALARLNDANKNYAAGTAPRFDVISAQRDVADAQQGLINARAQLSVNLAALKNVMGIDLHSRLRISNKDAVEVPPGVAQAALPAPAPAAPPAPIETPAPRPPGDVTGLQVPGALPVPNADEAEDTFEFGPEYDALVKDALAMRPEVLESDAQIAAARRGVEFARRSSLPSLSVGVSDTYTPNAAGFTRRNQAALVLGVNVPLFDGGLARERVREARGTAALAEIGRRRSVDQVKIDVQQAYIGLVQARDRVAVANVGLAQAREAFRLAQVRYNAGVSQQTGVSPQLELGNAQATLTQAQAGQVNALYDYNTARAQVDRAVGRNSFTGAGPGYPSAPAPAVLGGGR